MSIRGLGALFGVCVLALGCGAGSSIPLTVDGQVEHPPEVRRERCNGLDDDLDGEVDEPFRDALGHYVDDEHCGGCGRPCGAERPVLASRCELLDGAPICAAVDCAAGYVRSRSGHCVPTFRYLCMPCVDDGDCGDVEGARCVTLGGEPRCAEPCGATVCPLGFTCEAASSLCVPSGGSCTCDAGDSFDVACAVVDPNGLFCAGDARCRDGELSACVAPTEACNARDDDCDGSVDETYRDTLGAYSVDIHNCGACGVDCTTELGFGALTCGGDAFAPSCVLDCPDTHDGLQPGDRIDADRDIATGCECTLRSTTDDAGPVGASGEVLDVNCDGADGVVTESYYVATDGDDAGPGSPTRPLRTLGEATRRAGAASSGARVHVFVATGRYAETLRVPDGVRVHGGYRRDFLALEPDGFVVEVRALAAADGQGAPALVVEGPQTRLTEVAYMRFVGSDAEVPGSAAVGALLVEPNDLLTLTGNHVRSGVPTGGLGGTRGANGASPSAAATAGGLPRAADEDASHRCIAATGSVQGGRGGVNACGGVSVAGGNGGSSRCPAFGQFAADGTPGSASAGAAAGAGGHGGEDSSAPISGDACPGQPVCCGLADFNVTSDFVTPGPGGNGQNGSSGRSGEGCSDALGGFLSGRWIGALATAGASGTAGAGGGGGGAGGGVEFNWFAGLCQFADGLGGGGGGGGAGGCGGGPGLQGTSGGPSVAVLVQTSASRMPPVLVQNRFVGLDGAGGGDGGAGGTGGGGGIGAEASEIPRDQRTTPTLAGAFAGGRGGRGGDGGSGGAGGGGCGGASVGVWITGIGGTPPSYVGTWRANNQFVLGLGGSAGRGGGATGSAGRPGEVADVLTH